MTRTLLLSFGLLCACPGGVDDQCRAISLGTPVSALPAAMPSGTCNRDLIRGPTSGKVTELFCCARSRSGASDAGCTVDCALPEFGPYQYYQVGDLSMNSPGDTSACCALVRDAGVIATYIAYD